MKIGGKGRLRCFFLVGAVWVSNKSAYFRVEPAHYAWHLYSCILWGGAGIYGQALL